MGRTGSGNRLHGACGPSTLAKFMAANIREESLAWLIGIWELSLTMALVIWLLSRPALFCLYYPVLGVSSHQRDAVAIVDWLASSRRERSLNLALVDGQLGQKELKHFSD